MKLGWLAIVFWGLAVVAQGQDVKFQAAVDKAVVEQNETFQLSFTINASGQRFRAPALTEHFKVYSGPNQGRNVSFINGRISTSLTYSYVLAAINVGEFVIEPASIVVEGKTYTTNPIKIKVVSPAKRNNAQPQNQQGARNQQPAQTKANPTIEEQIRENVFLRLELDKNSVYQGDQIVASYRLYNRLDLVGLEGQKLPDFVGFYTSDIDLSNNNISREVRDGVVYEVYTLKKTILFPQRSGKLELKPLELQVAVRVKEPTPINTWFGPRYRYVNKRVQLRSNGANVTVKSLPGNQPSGFGGAVGKLQMETTLDKSSAKVNEALNLKIRVSGQGNISLLEVPDPELPTDFEVYDPKVTTDIANSTGKVQGSKFWEYLLIPRTAGTFTIPPLVLHYFDPASATYRKIESPEYTIQIESDGIGSGQRGGATVQRKRDVQQVGQDIRFIKLGKAEFQEEDMHFLGSAPFYLLLLLPFVLLGVGFVAYRRYAALQSDTVQLKRKKASRVARKHLKTARGMVDTGHPQALYEELFRALTGYLSDKLAIPRGELNKETIASTLQLKGWPDEEITEVTGLVAQCEMARFAPVVELTERELFNQIEGLLEKTENKLR